MHTASLNWNSSKGWQPQMDQEFQVDLILYFVTVNRLLTVRAMTSCEQYFPTLT